MCKPGDMDSPEAKGPAGGVASSLLLGAIRVYQLTLSSVMGRQCRYLPTCSEYTGDAIRAHGAWSGFWLGLSRVLSCNPWGGSGYDPVPATPSRPIWMFWRHKHPRPDRD